MTAIPNLVWACFLDCSSSFVPFKGLADTVGGWCYLLPTQKRRGIVTNPTVLWPAMLGVLFLLVGMIAYRADVAEPTSPGIQRLLPLGPVLVGAALAAFAGEHFTAAAAISRIVPKFMPRPLFIAYFVGVAHLAAGLSFVTKRYVRVSSICLAVMFALFVLLMDLPAAVARPGTRIVWILVARQATFSIGALALFAIVTSDSRRHAPVTIAAMARIWAACVLLFYGTQNVLFPHIAPGVPSTATTAAWVPAPHLIAYVTGIVLIACGLTMFSGKLAASGTAWSGLLMIVLTAALFVPQFFIAQSPGDQVTAINFVFDTLLFAGTVLTIGAATRLRTDGPKNGRVVPRDAMGGALGPPTVSREPSSIR